MAQSWGWIGSILSEVSSAQVVFCTKLDEERDSVFHTQIVTRVTSRDEEPLVWNYTHLRQAWDIQAIRREPETRETYRNTLQVSLTNAMFDLEAADSIIDLFSTKLSKST